MKSEKGVTLIVLTITVLVMLILASVVINVAISDGGIFDTTQESVDKTSVGTELEELHVIVEQALNDGVVQGYGSYLTEKSLYISIKETVGYDSEGYITKIFVSENGSDGYLFTFTDSKRQYSVTKSGEVNEEYITVDNIESVENIFAGIKDVEAIE